MLIHWWLNVLVLVQQFVNYLHLAWRNTNNYSSNENPHKNKISKLKENDIEYYKIEHKLDNYYKILNPRDPFYYDIYFKNEIDYSNYYKLHFSPENNIRNIVSDYLKGFNWIVSYYHNNNKYYNNIDLTWYYRHNRSPLLRDIINDANVKLLNIRMNNTFNIEKHKQYTVQTVTRQNALR